jgi:hypothetical protein
MRSLSIPFASACLIALSVGLVLAARQVQAQTPAPTPVPAPAVAQPVPTNPIARSVTAQPARVAAPNVNVFPMRSRTRVYTVPAQGTPNGQRRLHYGYWPARRELPLFKPWLNPD